MKKKTYLNRNYMLKSFGDDYSKTMIFIEIKYDVLKYYSCQKLMILLKSQVKIQKQV